MVETSSVHSLAIIGGGQLGRMLALAAIPLGIKVHALDPDPQCPAAAVATTTTARLDDNDALRAVVTSNNVTTVEIEEVGVATLAELEAEGHCVYPSPRALATIRDKGIQKRFLQEKNIPVAPEVPGLGPWKRTVVQKLRTGGYDGRGVAVLAPGEDRHFQEPSIFEEAIDIAHELAVMVCRFPDGAVVSWDPVAMHFDPQLHLVSHVLSPALGAYPELTADIIAQARETASAVASAFGEVGLVGLLAVELFLTTSGSILVNEVAPRPHNSGHVTIETSRCNQFQQHIRAVCSLPPGDTTNHSPGVMRNIVAPPEARRGPTEILNLDRALQVPGVSVHLYGKAEQRPGRKMGHISAIAPTLAEARQRVDKAWNEIQFREER